jgi:hypothetical protein
MGMSGERIAGVPPGLVIVLGMVVIRETGEVVMVKRADTMVAQHDLRQRPDR